ncbi:hypothetical protein TWF694_002104 [Orbilia ellipsospora]|uniref:DUF2470 domain-containing protein n=1 Tax=Orbilia ellipsospora TaxID=2528407 RepID=A0AAV9X7F8_9PEZI
MASSQEDAVRTRILNHMNKDHVYDTKLYLIHRLQYPKSLLLPSDTSTVRISDIRTTHITIAINDEIKEIPFNPPMNSLSDSRVRLVEMTREAEKAVGVDRDQVSIKPVWLPPQTSSELSVFFLLLAAMYIMFFPTTLLPGGFLRSTILKDYGNIAELMYRQTSWASWLYIVLHIGETGWFISNTLARYRAIPGIDVGVATLWALDVLLNGYPAVARWKKMVKRQKSKSGKKDH